MVSTPSELGTRGVERELAKLFGESLFGPWPELTQLSVTAPPPRRRRRWVWLVVSLVVLLATALGISAIIRPGLARRTSDERAHLAQDLRIFLRDGDLERVSRFIALVRQQRDSGQDNAHRELLVRADAAAYRYLDADPERLRRIQPGLAAAFEPNAAPDLVVAGFTVLSREERKAHIPRLERLRDQLSRESEVYYLLATALEQRGDITAARQAWEESARLGPAWLAHRFEQAEFERRQGNQRAAVKIVRRMVGVDPQSAWSRLATRAFGVSPDETPSQDEAGHGPQSAPPVEVFYARLLQSVAAAEKDELGQARRYLTEAAEAVHGQAPFLLDAFDWLVTAGSEALARELTALPAWPSRSETARTKARRLAEAPGKARQRP